MLSCVALQVVYDEGPLYVFSPTEELRRRWIHQLKSGESGGSAAPPKQTQGMSRACGVTQSTRLPGFVISWFRCPMAAEE